MKSIGILFPHQLFEKHELHRACDEIFLIEEFLFFRQFSFHKVKLAYHRASMRSFKERMEQNGTKIKYIESHEKEADIRHFLKQHNLDEIAEVHYIDPTDDWLSKRIQQSLSKFKGTIIEHENPLFLNTKEALRHFFKHDKKSFFQTNFYKQERKKRNLLLQESGDPEGGKWTFDADNRKKYPKNAVPPVLSFPEAKRHWENAYTYVEEHYQENPGELSTRPYYPYQKEEALAWLDEFLTKRFEHFGDYEDAILRSEVFLHHSVLTPMLNVGILCPHEVVKNSIAAAEKYAIPLNSVEGFIRQIIGWREFIRGMYEVKGVEMRTKNHWKFSRKIPKSFYTGNTGIPPVDDSINKVLKYGYCHHIERLMVLGNFMLLCEFDPKEVYRWFMELFVDAYDWVMVPNVYGMSQFADGGLFATKPYISSSNYILKMSDYSKGDWQKSWDGLFWHFMDKQRDFFRKNPRLSMLLNTFDKMQPEKKAAHLEAAAAFFVQLDNA